MIGLDTNVIVRFLTQDDPIQSPIATEIFETRLTEDEPGFISVIAMTETVWVLERAYGLRDAQIVSVVEGLLRSNTLTIEREQEVFTAMIALKEEQGDFADALIGALGVRSGCSYTLTFDRKALRLPEFAAP